MEYLPRSQLCHYQEFKPGFKAEHSLSCTTYTAIVFNKCDYSDGVDCVDGVDCADGGTDGVDGADDIDGEVGLTGVVAWSELAGGQWDVTLHGYGDITSYQQYSQGQNNWCYS